MSKSIFKMKEKEMLSMDIGSHSIKMLVGKYEKNSVTINKAVTIETPNDTLYNEEIIDMRLLKEVIAGALHNHKIKAINTVCTLESTSIITREIDLPAVKPEQIKSMLEFEIEQYLPIQMDQYIVQYKLLETFKDKDIQKTKVLVTALPKKIAGDYLHLIESLGLKPIALDIHSNGIDKVFNGTIKINDVHDFSNKTIAVIDLGHTQVNITIIEKGIFKFNRLLKMGGRDIDVNICNFLDLTLEEAELKKKGVKDINEGHQNFAAASSDGIEEVAYDLLKKEMEDVSSDSRLLNIIKTSIDNWIGEIEKVFKYYTSRNTGNVIDEIYIYGGSGELGGIIQYLEGAFNIPTLKINGIGNLNNENNGTVNNIASYVNNIGALIRR